MSDIPSLLLSATLQFSRLRNHRSIVQSLREDGKVEIRGFGSFRTRQRGGRIGRNPKTGEAVEVPPKTIPFFKPSKELQELINRE